MGAFSRELSYHRSVQSYFKLRKAGAVLGEGIEGKECTLGRILRVIVGMIRAAKREYLDAWPGARHVRYGAIIQLVSARNANLQAGEVVEGEQRLECMPCVWVDYVDRVCVTMIYLHAQSPEIIRLAVGRKNSVEVTNVFQLSTTLHLDLK
jgi:hypothetical protein